MKYRCIKYELTKRCGYIQFFLLSARLLHKFSQDVLYVCVCPCYIKVRFFLIPDHRYSKMMIATAESQTRDVYTSLLKQIKTDKSLKRNQWRLPCWIKYTSQSCWVYVPENYCKRLNFVIYVSFFAKFNYLISIKNFLFMTLF